jgi:hypothetical protein
MSNKATGAQGVITVVVGFYKRIDVLVVTPTAVKIFPEKVTRSSARRKS